MNFTPRPFLFFFLRVLGLLICPKLAEAKIKIKHSAFLYTPQCKKKKKKKKQPRSLLTRINSSSDGENKYGVKSQSFID